MKKVLSFVLVLSLVLSSFSMAFAGTAPTATLSDVEGNANAEAIGVAYDLGIVTGNPDGTFQPTKAVTRAEFAAMITRALAIPESALAGYASTSFNDTEGYGWAVPYLAFCNSKGIMLGDGAGNAMPGKTISVNEAVTMALRAIGYTANSARLQGVWPSNYVTLAQDLGIYEDVAKNAGGVDKANAAQIVYNVLTEPKVSVNADGDTSKMWNDKDNDGEYDADETYVTLLTAGLDCTQEDADIVELSDIEDSLINMAKNLGKYGNIYKNKDGEIVAFIADCEQLNGRFWTDGSDIIFKTGDEVEYTVKGISTVSAIHVANSSYNYGLNAGEFNLVAGAPAATNLVDNGWTYTINVDLSGKTVKEIYSAVAYNIETAVQVDKADLEEIAEDQEILGFEFILDDNDEIDYNQFVLVGAASLDKIAEDDVVYVVVDDNDEVRMVAVSNKTVEGTVSNLKNAKDFVSTKFAIGTQTFKNAAENLNVEDVTEFSIVDGDDVAEDVILYLDAYGFVFDYESTAKTDKYAVVEKLDSGITDEAKLMFADGTEKVVEFDVESAEWDALTEGALIGYALDKDGIVEELDLTATEAGIATLESINVMATAKLGDLDVSEDVVVFTYDAADDEFDVTAIKSVELDEDLTAGDFSDVIVLLDDGEVVAMIISANVAESGDSVYAVVNEYNKTANADGDAVYEVVGYKNGEKFSALTDDKTGVFNSPIYTPDYNTPKTIQIFDLTINGDGVITKAELVTPDSDVVRVENTCMTDANGRKSVTASGTKYALDANVVIYKLDSDEYKLYNGSLKAGDYCYLYNLDADDDSDFDVVVFERP